MITGAMKLRLTDIRNRMFDVFAIKSYSQEGEDMLLNRMFEGKRQGFFVDVGAHHPRRFSNTYFFYKRGWTGINVEPNPAMFRLFRSERLRDINLQCGVGEKEGKCKYYLFDEPALNTFDDAVAQSRLDRTPYKIVSEASMEIFRLDNILKQHLPAGQHIDFLSVDVEGMDLSVLKSNDWALFRPTCVLAEALDTDFEDTGANEISIFMRAQQYRLFAKSYNTIIFRDARA